jgi:hypothetical protein
MSNQNANVDKHSCPRAWGRTIAFWAAQMGQRDRAFGGKLTRVRLKLFGVVAGRLVAWIEANEPCGCHECTRQYSTRWKTWRDAT